MSHEEASKALQTSEWWPRYKALIEVTDYLERGASELRPPPERSPDGQSLDLILRLKQWIPLEGPRVSRAIYSPPRRFQPSALPEVVRQITWDSEHDRISSRSRLVTWPSVTIDYYQIGDRNDWRRADLALRKLEERFGAFPFDGAEAPGLSLTHDDYVPGPDLGHTRSHEVRSRRPYARTLFLELSWGTVQATFREGQDSDFDWAWDEAWDALTQICRPGHQVQGYEANYFIRPESLSDFLVRAAAGEQPAE